MRTYNQNTAAREQFARSAFLNGGRQPIISIPTSNHTGAMTVLRVGANAPAQTAAVHYSDQFMSVCDYFSLGIVGYIDPSTGVNPVYGIVTRPVLVSPVLTPSEMLNTVRDTFILNVSDAARVFRVTRPTIYQWATLDDISQIRARNVLTRMKELYSLAIEWRALGTLTGRWANMPLRTSHGQSVIDLLTADQIDHQAVLGAHAQLKAASVLLRQSEIDRSVKAVKALEGAFTRMDELLQGRERGRS